MIGAPWIAAPAIAIAAFVRASPTRLGALLFLVFEFALILWTAWFTYGVYAYGNSTASIGFLFLPILQWGAVLVAFLIALALGWRMRPDFMKD
ncbi:hypothetical protein RCO27_03340 [Sphingosinicella sp. LHD-64]|uniref:hypothetical protein n=1 Tax=Sphingosinicella sp. LHD-64 TaxID=3072139 RepID=UPI0028107E9D|nr:hypothetical protein [Sphingosinicella sp. LHD-64]MDQ8755256.1 hypothetical protein [Sphingosinicella sp. LHD-64]